MHSLLDEPVKQQTTSPSTTPVEAERIFIGVVVEMFVANRPLVRAQDPTLESTAIAVNKLLWVGFSLKSLRLAFSHIDGRPRFAKPSFGDGKKVEIAAIDPDFCLRPQSLSLMECAGRFLNTLTSFSLPV